MTTKYHLEGSKIVFEDRNGTMLYYIYNGDELIGFKYDNNIYYYHKNIFGDIIGILDTNYNEVVTYKYDSWGAISSIVDNSGINLGTINPFRYRSYYYDEETQLYYLNSRYYSSNLRRFINPDEIVSGQGIISNNLYLYCGNNPIDRKDEEGNAWIIASLVVGGVSAIFNSIMQIGSNYITGEQNLFDNVAGAAFGGFVSGFVAATPLNIIGNKARYSINLISSLAEALINQSDEEKFDETEFATDAFVGAFSVYVGAKYGKTDINDILPNKKTSKNTTKNKIKKAINSTFFDSTINHTVNNAATLYNKEQNQTPLRKITTVKINQTPLPYLMLTKQKSYFTPIPTWAKGFFS